ncbi:MAG: hypothetical protein LBV40_00015 [Methanomicrobiales archaeon]|nr:hypothetical protein [Methanomicrobiales archaeon]
MKLEEMLVLYDYVAFAEEHLNEFYPYNGDYTEIKETRSAIAWPWPGAGELLWTVEDLDTTHFYVTYAYKDEQGREWGFVPYLYGSRNIWVCLSDPQNRDLPAFNPAPEPDVWVSETVHVDIKHYASENEFSVVIVIIGLVTVLVAGTAVLIRVFWKPNKTNLEEKMINRLLIVFTFVFLLIVPLATHADVVFGNEFFYENRDRTESIRENSYGERFIVNSPSGYVIPKEEPGSKKGVPTGFGYRGSGDEEALEPEGPVFVFQNGETVRIEAIFLHNGEYWGVMSPSHVYQPPGWVPMDELLMIYDPSDFELENKDTFYPYTGSYDAVLSANKLVLWEWPGSDREKRVIENKDTISNCADVLYAYKDEEGREWGKTTYMGGWICLSDPENNKIPVFYPASEPTKWLPEDKPDDKNSWSIHDFRDTLQKILQKIS